MFGYVLNVCGKSFGDLEHFSVINYFVNTEIIFLHNYQFIMKDSNNPNNYIIFFV